MARKPKSQKPTGYDVIVVGAGIAGSLAAGMLAGKGYSVLLTDRRPSSQLGHPWPQSVEKEVFEELAIPHPTDEELGPSPGLFRLLDPSGKYAVEATETGLIHLRARPYLQRRVEEACEAGAELLPRFRVTGPLIEGEQVVGIRGEVSDGSERFFEARLVLDASGFEAVLRRHYPANIHFPAHVRDENCVSACAEVWTVDPSRIKKTNCPPYLKKGHSSTILGVQGGMVNVSSSTENLVVITAACQTVSGNQSAEQIAASYRKKIPCLKEKVGGGQGLIAIRRPFDSFVAPGLMLLGEAACQVVPMLGSGIASAFLSATIASQVAAEALEHDLVTVARLWPYNVRFQQSRGAVLAALDVYRMVLQSLSEEEMKGLFEMGLINSAMVNKTFQTDLIRFTPKDILCCFPQAVLRLPLFFQVFSSILDAKTALRLYWDYPVSWNEREFLQWKDRQERLFSKYSAPHLPENRSAPMAAA